MIVLHLENERVNIQNVKYLKSGRCFLCTISVGNVEYIKTFLYTKIEIRIYLTRESTFRLTISDQTTKIIDPLYSYDLPYTIYNEI